MGKQANGTIPEGTDCSTEACSHPSAVPPPSATAGEGCRSAEAEAGIGAVITAHWGGVRCNGTALPTAAADRLQQHTMGSGASGEIGAVGKERHCTTGAPHTTVAAHRKGCREIAARSGGIHRTTRTTAAAHRLKEDRHGVVAAGFNSECCGGPAAPQVDAAAVGAVAAIAAITRAQSEGHAGVGAAGGHIAAADHRAAGAAAAANRLQQDAVGAVAGA